MVLTTQGNIAYSPPSIRSFRLANQQFTKHFGAKYKVENVRSLACKAKAKAWKPRARLSLFSHASAQENK